MARQISYVIATEYRNGAYQGTFDWGGIDAALNFMGNYWDIQFVRTGNYGAARYKIVQAQTNPNSSWAAWTNGSLTKISPVFRFGNNKYLCARVLIHEFMHAAGGGGHSSDPKAIMAPNGGTSHNITASDYRWMAPYAWKSALRPHQEPTKMRDKFALPGAPLVDSSNLAFGCGKKSWYNRLFPQISVP